MSISSSALTLAQFAMLANDIRIAAPTFSLIDNGSVYARDIPFRNKKSFKVGGVRWVGSLPDVNWVNVNDEGVTVTGSPTPYEEQSWLVRNYIDTDHYLVEEENQITNPHAARVTAWLKGFAYEFNDKFINNNHTTGNAKAFIGIRARLDNTADYGVRSENKINAAAIMTTAATAANFAAFREKLDQLLWSVDSPEGNGVVIYMNSNMRWRLSALAGLYAGQGGFSQATDQIGRTVDVYKGAQIRDIGLKADQSTKIITSTESSVGADSNSTYTSIYAVNYGEDHQMGWQFEPLVPKDVPGQDNGVIVRTLCEWQGGLVSQSNRSIARLYGINLG